MSDDLSAAAKADLDWWWTKARTLKWNWARTFADRAPHWWIMPGRTPGMTDEDFLRANRLIRRYGVPGKYWSFCNLYLISPEGTHKVWAQFPDEPDPNLPLLINLAHTDMTYGPQDLTEADKIRLNKLRLPAE